LNADRTRCDSPHGSYRRHLHVFVVYILLSTLFQDTVTNYAQQRDMQHKQYKVEYVIKARDKNV